MHPRAAEFRDDARERYGLSIGVHEFEAGTKTATDAARAIGCDVAQIGSSLVFVARGTGTSTAVPDVDVDDGEIVVVVTSGANRVSEDRLAAALDATEVRMADPDEVRASTGWSIGGVPPFCHRRDLRVLVDETVMTFDEVWVAAGTPAAVFPIAPDRLVSLADGTVVTVAK